MLHGKATIQLINAKTNKIEKEIIEENMITDASTNLLNMSFRHDLYQLQSVKSDPLNTYSPLYSNLFGGILLLSKNLTEDANNILPVIDDFDHFVGCAGSNNAVTTSKYHGSYNLQESVAITNGYRHVFDFDTNEANGTVNCIALTSKAGGDAGLIKDANDTTISSMFAAYGIDPLDKTEAKMATGTNCADCILPFSKYVKDGYFVGLKDKNTAYTIIKTDDTHYTVRTYEVGSSFNILEDIPMFSEDNVANYDYLYNVGGINKISENVITSTTKLMNPKFIKSGNDSVLHSLYVEASGATITIYRNDIDLSTMTITNSITYTVTNSVSESFTSDLTILFNQKIFWTYYKNNNFVIYEYDISGNTLTQHENLLKKIDNYSYYPSYFSDTVALFGCYDPGSNANCLIPVYVYSLSKNEWYYNSIYTYNGYSSEISIIKPNQYKKPVISFRTNSKYNQLSCINLNVFTPFYSSINNLSTPITKTNTQTMKIIYEITHA